MTALMENGYIRKMENGFYLVEDNGVWKLARCQWLVERPSGHPEPDSPSDLYVIEDCGARITWFSETGASFRCEAGHEHVAYTEGGADIEYEREMNERAHGGGW